MQIFLKNLIQFTSHKSFLGLVQRGRFFASTELGSCHAVYLQLTLTTLEKPHACWLLPSSPSAWFIFLGKKNHFIEMQFVCYMAHPLCVSPWCFGVFMCFQMCVATTRLSSRIFITAEGNP